MSAILSQVLIMCLGDLTNLDGVRFARWSARLRCLLVRLYSTGRRVTGDGDRVGRQLRHVICVAVNPTATLVIVFTDNVRMAATCDSGLSHVRTQIAQIALDDPRTKTKLRPWYFKLPQSAPIGAQCWCRSLVLSRPAELKLSLQTEWRGGRTSGTAPPYPVARRLSVWPSLCD